MLERKQNEEIGMHHYQALFRKTEDKAAAFDQIAEHFYGKNFGSMAKADMETLMFSIYIDQILDKGDENFSAYSDYRLARDLGITQSRVRSLKVRKQQKYPRDFEWKKAFERVSKNARYENGKIKIQIPDINLYYEIQNAVEESGGFIDVSLTPKLLQISPVYFLDLLMAVAEEDAERKTIRKAWRTEFRKQQEDQEYFEEEPIGQQMAAAGKEAALSVLSSVLSDLVTNGSAISSVCMIAKHVRAILPPAR